LRLAQQLTPILIYCHKRGGLVWLRQLKLSFTWLLALLLKTASCSNSSSSIGFSANTVATAKAVILFAQ